MEQGIVDKEILGLLEEREREEILVHMIVYKITAHIFCHNILILRYISLLWLYVKGMRDVCFNLLSVILSVAVDFTKPEAFIQK